MADDKAKSGTNTYPTENSENFHWPTSKDQPHIDEVNYTPFAKLDPITGAPKVYIPTDLT